MTGMCRVSHHLSKRNAVDQVVLSLCGKVCDNPTCVIIDGSFPVIEVSYCSLKAIVPLSIVPPTLFESHVLSCLPLLKKDDNRDLDEKKLSFVLCIDQSINQLVY